MRKRSFVLALFCAIAFIQSIRAEETKEVTIAITGMT